MQEKRFLRRNWAQVALIVLMVLLFAFGWSLYSAGLLDATQILSWIRSQPTLAPLAFIAMLTFSTAFILPLGLALNLGAGIVWGGMLGGLLTTIASVVAASVSFVIARKVADTFLEKPLSTKQTQEFLEIVKRHDWKVMFLVRLNPVIPYGLQNYMFGLTGIGLLRFVLLTLASCAIPAFLFAHIGESLDSLVLRGEMSQALTIAGLILLFLTIAFLGRLYLRRLSQSEKS